MNTIDNREVAISSIVEHINPPSNLEDYLVSLGNQSSHFYSFEHLPHTITLTQLETYANSLEAETAKDGKERGAYVSLASDDPHRLTFPEKPTMGDENAVTHVVQYEEWKGQYPVIGIHTHPASATFSPHDFLKQIVDLSEVSVPVPMNIASLVATSHRNYLLVRAKETQSWPPEPASLVLQSLGNSSERESLASAKAMVENYLLDNHTKASAEHQEAAINKILPWARYFFTIQTALRIAGKYRLGFYFSDKDGEYKRITRENLDEARELSRQKMRELLRQTFSNLT